MPGHPSFRTHAAARRASVDHTAAISAVRRASVDHTAGIIKPCDSTHAGHSPNITQCRPHAALHHECARMVVLANTANDVPALPQPLSGRQSPSVPKQEQVRKHHTSLCTGSLQSSLFLHDLVCIRRHRARGGVAPKLKSALPHTRGGLVAPPHCGLGAGHLSTTREILQLRRH